MSNCLRLSNAPAEDHTKGGEVVARYGLRSQEGTTATNLDHLKGRAGVTSSRDVRDQARGTATDRMTDGGGEIAGDVLLVGEVTLEQDCKD